MTAGNLSSAQDRCREAKIPPIYPMSSRYTDRSAAIQARMEAAAQRSGRAASEVRLVAVAKTATPATLHEAWEAGQRHFAHNRVQPLLEHHAVLPEANWHLIGPLQRNKARKAVERVQCIETLADLKLAHALNRLAAELRSEPLPVLLQINRQPEDGRPGLAFSDPARDRDLIHGFCQELTVLENLELRGLMTIAAAEADEAELHRHFRGVRELATDLVQNRYLPAQPELSMGMSGDFEIAIEEGATLVRVGRALFPPAS